MSKQLVMHQPPEAFTKEWAELVRISVCENATDAEMSLFLYQCKKTGLDPLAKQIYMQKRRNQKRNRDEMTIITGIDGYRLTAQRTGEYAGSDDAVFDNEDNPRKATVVVYRIVKGVRCAFAASARWDQYYPGDTMGFMWRKMPHLMLGKCAEALALRKAFPQELSGIYVKEEMDQAGEALEAEAHHVAVSSQPTTKVTPIARKPSVYIGSAEQEKLVFNILQKEGVPEQFWGEIDAQLRGKPSTELKNVIQAVREGATIEGVFDT